MNKKKRETQFLKHPYLKLLNKTLVKNLNFNKIILKTKKKIKLFLKEIKPLISENFIFDGNSGRL